MKVLFVCWANVGRSQMAAAYYNDMTGTRDAVSAGTGVELSGETLGERRARRGGTAVLEYMSEQGLDISDSPQTQLSEGMLVGYDRIISMADKQYTPEWLSIHPLYEYWEVEDPGGKDYSKTKEAGTEIKLRVHGLIAEMESKKS